MRASMTAFIGSVMMCPLGFSSPSLHSATVECRVDDRREHCDRNLELVHRYLRHLCDWRGEGDDCCLRTFVTLP